MADKRLRKSYTIKFKLQVVLYARRNSIRKASKSFKVDRKSVREWLKNRDKMFELRDKKHRSYLRKKNTCFFPQLEAQLKEYVELNRRNGVCVSSSMLIHQATIIANERGIVNFSGKIIYSVN